VQRNIYNCLIKWKNSKTRMPLLLRGARQIGKTYIVEAFAKTEFTDYLSINFELNPEYCHCFSELEPRLVLERLSLTSGKTILPGKSLLFLDEIQECPRAIQALRYFKEQCPDLHLVGAGSLLEFALNQQDFRMPVGRVEFMYMYPLTFIEFLNAVDHSNLSQHLLKVDIKSGVDNVVHEKLLKLMRLFFMLGGMPAVVQAYKSGESLQRCQSIQAFLLNGYRNDFGKYASLIYQQHCRRVFEKAPSLIAQHFKYVDVDPDIQSRSIKTALRLLMQAGLMLPVYETKVNSAQLNASINEKKFKLLFLDVGLASYVLKLNSEIKEPVDLLSINHGAIAEQYVGQELIAHQPNFQQSELYFWQRAKRNDSAEIDYVITVDNKILPVEVKAGKTGRLKSLQTFMKEKKSVLGIKISQDKLYIDGKVLSLPLYMISQLERIVSTILVKRC